jgi:hypothetical protein
MSSATSVVQSSARLAPAARDPTIPSHVRAVACPMTALQFPPFCLPARIHLLVPMLRVKTPAAPGSVRSHGHSSNPKHPLRTSVSSALHRACRVNTNRRRPRPAMPRETLCGCDDIPPLFRATTPPNVFQMRNNSPLDFQKPSPKNAKNQKCQALLSIPACHAAPMYSLIKKTAVTSVTSVMKPKNPTVGPKTTDSMKERSPW